MYRGGTAVAPLGLGTQSSGSPVQFPLGQMEYLSEAGFVLGHLVVGQLVLPREVAQLFNLINLCSTK